MTDVRRLVLVIAAGLAACTVGPDYRKPAVDAPASFQYLPADVKDTANTEWWKAFGDPVLDALIDEALANNRNVKVATANVEAAAALFTQAFEDLTQDIGMQPAQSLVDGDVAIVPVRGEPDQAVSAQQTAKPRTVGAARGHAVALVDDYA